jgi:hypothetical protein
MLTVAHVACGDVGEDGERCAVGVPGVGARPALAGRGGGRVAEEHVPALGGGAERRA